MAWTEQCKIAFRTNAEGLIHKNGGKGIVKVLKELSRQSDIPFETLKKWYYPKKKIVKNDNGTLTGLNHDGKDAGHEDDLQAKWPKCQRCRRNKVERNYRTGKPNKNGLCRSCRRAKVVQRELSEARKQWDATPVDDEAEKCWTEIIQELNSVLDRESVLFGKVGNDVLTCLSEFQDRFGSYVNVVLRASLPPGG